MEAAIREVEEECGIDSLEILEELETTYHIFTYKNQLRLKVTYWYLMHTRFIGELIPQLEEGITKVVFKGEEEVKEALQKHLWKYQIVILKLLFCEVFDSV